MAQNTVKALTLATMDAALLTANFQSINPGGIAHAAFLLHITNDSNIGIAISYDGVNFHEHIPSTKEIIINAQSNAQPNAQTALFSAFTQVWVVSTNGLGGVGTIALSGYYV